MLDMFLHVKKREIPELNVVPILDMLICVIFFLLLGTTFTQFTKITLPPSAVSTAENPVAAPPLSPQLVVVQNDGKLRMILSWAGKEPGERVKDLALTDAASKEEQASLFQQSRDLIAEFVAKFPSEKTLRLGLGADVSYQKMVTIMDGAREKMADIVLFSYDEAKLRADKLKTN